MASTSYVPVPPPLVSKAPELFVATFIMIPAIINDAPKITPPPQIHAKLQQYLRRLELHPMALQYL